MRSGLESGYAEMEYLCEVMKSTLSHQTATPLVAETDELAWPMPRLWGASCPTEIDVRGSPSHKHRDKISC